MSHPGSARRLNETGSLMLAGLTAQMRPLGLFEALHDACRPQAGRPFHGKIEHVGDPRLPGACQPLRKAEHAESPKRGSECRNICRASRPWKGRCLIRGAGGLRGSGLKQCRDASATWCVTSPRDTLRSSQVKPRGVRQKMSGFPLRKRGPMSRQEHRWTPEIVSNCA